MITLYYVIAVLAIVILYLLYKIKTIKPFNVSFEVVEVTSKKDLTKDLFTACKIINKF
jgi:hypothetical protein